MKWGCAEHSSSGHRVALPARLFDRSRLLREHERDELALHLDGELGSGADGGTVRVEQERERDAYEAHGRDDRHGPLRRQVGEELGRELRAAREEN